MPGKPLADLAGKPMIQWVWERARRARSLGRVLVATDDARVLDAVRAFGGEAVMTSREHPSGTDRVAEVARKFPVPLVVNIQGDEPLLEPRMIDEAVDALRKARRHDMATLCRRIEDPPRASEPGLVKVVRARDGTALYFSRHPIPFDRDGGGGVVRFAHVGLYVYRAAALRRLVRWPVSALEAAEKLEQLRAMENGLRIMVRETRHGSHGVDTPADLARVAEMIRRGNAAADGGG